MNEKTEEQKQREGRAIITKMNERVGDILKKEGNGHALGFSSAYRNGLYLEMYGGFDLMADVNEQNAPKLEALFLEFGQKIREVLK